MKKDSNLQEDCWPGTHQRGVWRNLSPSERLRRSWSMRQLLKDKKGIHDKKLFPQP